MITVIATGDRESDLYYWTGITKKDPELKNIPSIDCTTENGLQRLLQKLETISLLSESTPLVCHYPEISETILALFTSYTENIFIISPTGKLPKLPREITVITEKITDTTLKLLIADTLKKLSIALDRDQTVRLYIPLTIDDYMGKERLSPLRCLTFLRQVETISGSTPEEVQKSFMILLGLQEGKASQWEILAQLFTTNKVRQKDYFVALAETMSPYEIMSMAKSTLLLVMAILKGRQEGIDSASIAKKIGKHPFYVGSLLKTTELQKITYEKAEKILTRLMNLELALKSGRFEDESFGFEVLLATN
ncbi:hypothetical protein IT418_03815 [bacterium]|nr:hypothetical protein [bacterium]